MELKTVERHKTIVDQGECMISIIILTFLCWDNVALKKWFNGEYFDSISELYFLVAKFLLESPYKRAGEVRMDRA